MAQLNCAKDKITEIVNLIITGITIFSVLGQMATLQANIIRVKSDTIEQKSSLTSLDNKIQTLEVTNANLKKENSSYLKENQTMSSEIEMLQAEKLKLLTKLKNADEKLSTLSSKIYSPSRVASNQSRNLQVESSKALILETVSSVIGNEIKVTLDEIKGIVQKFPQSPDNINSNSVLQLNDELKETKVALLREKSNNKYLEKVIEDLEKFVDNLENENETESKKEAELRKLRLEHRRCGITKKESRRLRHEKCSLKRKLNDAQKQYQLLKVLYESMEKEVANKELICKNLSREKGQIENDKSKLMLDLEKLKQDSSEKEANIEKIKRESCYLLEKVNKSSEENELLKKKCHFFDENLSELLNMTSMKDNVVNMNTRIEQLYIESKKFEEENFRLIYQNQNDLMSQFSQLQKKFDTQEIPFHNTSAVSSDSDVVPKEEHERIVENLTLERDILSSRVLVLESIREEMEILRKERIKFKEESEKFKSMLSNNSINGITEQNPDISQDGLVILRNESELDGSLINESSAVDFLESVKTLEDLNETDKVKLKKLLSTPEFEGILSTDDIKIDLHNKNINGTSDSGSSLEQESLINHLYEIESDFTLSDKASEEFVENVYEGNISDHINEKTLKYTHNQEDQSLKISQPSNTDTKATSTERSLEKVINKSKLISTGIVLQQKRSKETNSFNLLNEFQKVIEEISAKDSSRSMLTSPTGSDGSFSKHKHVKFSDKVIDLMEGSTHKDQKVGNDYSDSSFSRSFFQESLLRNFPILTQHNDEDLLQEQGEESNNTHKTATNTLARDMTNSGFVHEYLREPR